MDEKSPKVKEFNFLYIWKAIKVPHVRFHTPSCHIKVDTILEHPVWNLRKWPKKELNGYREKFQWKRGCKKKSLKNHSSINKPCDEVLGAAQCKRLETSFMSTNVKLRKRLRYDLLLTVTWPSSDVTGPAINLDQEISSPSFDSPLSLV